MIQDKSRFEQKPYNLKGGEYYFEVIEHQQSDNKLDKRKISFKFKELEPFLYDS